MTRASEQIALIRAELAEMGIGEDLPVSGPDAVDYLNTLAERLAIEEPAEGREDETIASAIDRLANAHYAAGEWRAGDDTEYEDMHAECVAAERNLLEVIAQAQAGAVREATDGREDDPDDISDEERRIRGYELLGMTRSDAQACVMADDAKAAKGREHCPLCGEYLPHRTPEDCAGHPVKQLRK